MLVGYGKLSKESRTMKQIYMNSIKFIEAIYPTDGGAVGRALSLGIDAVLKPMAFHIFFASCLHLFF